jgi:hypothetical protein
MVDRAARNPCDVQGVWAIFNIVTSPGQRTVRSTRSSGLLVRCSSGLRPPGSESCYAAGLGTLSLAAQHKIVFYKRIALFMMLALYRNRVDAPWWLGEQGVWLASPVAPERCFWVAVLGADVAFGLAIDPGCSSQTTFWRRRLTSRSLWRAIRKITSPEDSIPSRSWQGNESQWLGAAGSGMLRGALEPNRKRTDVLQIQSGIQARLVFAISLLSDMAGL